MNNKIKTASLHRETPLDFFLSRLLLLSFFHINFPSRSFLSLFLWHFGWCVHCVARMNPQRHAEPEQQRLATEQNQSADCLFIFLRATLCVWCVCLPALPHELLIKALLAQSITRPPRLVCNRTPQTNSLRPSWIIIFYFVCTPHMIYRVLCAPGALGASPPEVLLCIRSVHANLPLSAGILSNCGIRWSQQVRKLRLEECDAGQSSSLIRFHVGDASQILHKLMWSGNILREWEFPC